MALWPPLTYDGLQVGHEGGQPDRGAHDGRPGYHLGHVVPLFGDARLHSLPPRDVHRDVELEAVREEDGEGYQHLHHLSGAEMEETFCFLICDT